MTHLVRIAALALAMCLGTAASAQPQRSDVSMAVAAARSHLAAHEAEIVQELRDLLALPNIADEPADIRANADALVTMLQRRGVAARVLETPGAPVSVFGELRTPGARRTIVFYAHFDGQPTGAVELWATPAFTPTLRAGRLEDGAAIIAWGDAVYPLAADARIYARSSSDDKGPIVAMLAALDSLRAAGIAPAVNLKFYLEGEEEAGSPNLTRAIAAHQDLLQSDLWVFGDGPIDAGGDPRVVLGVRGIVSFRITVFGAAFSLHSGHYGNVAPNPGARLAHLIASMRDEDGRISIAGFARAAPAPSARMRALARTAFDEAALLAGPEIARTESGQPYGESILRPALNVTQLSYGGEGPARNAIDPEATVTFDLRLTPGLSPDQARALIVRHLAEQGYHLVDATPSTSDRLNYGRLARLQWGELGYRSAMAPLDYPGVARLIEVMREATDNQVRVAPLLGGSLPIALIGDILDAPFVIVPIVNADNNQHAPNENLRMLEFRRGAELYAALLAAADW